MRVAVHTESGDALDDPALSIQFADQSYFVCLFFFISGYFTPILCACRRLGCFRSTSNTSSSSDTVQYALCHPRARLPQTRLLLARLRLAQLHLAQRLFALHHMRCD